jgi:uncharacterized protein HemX
VLLDSLVLREELPMTWTKLFWSSPEIPAAPPAATPPQPAAPPLAGVGDPKIDQLLIAFESMKGAMPAPQLAIALRATAQAIGVDPASVVHAVGERLTALDISIAEQRRKAGERETTRTTELAAATTKVRAEIEQMERAIAARRQQLAEVTDKLHQMTNDERATVATFETKARDEAARLVALRDVLGPAR